MLVRSDTFKSRRVIPSEVQTSSVGLRSERGLSEKAGRKTFKEKLLVEKQGAMASWLMK